MSERREQRERELRLRVAEARQRDVNRKIVRISEEHMRKLGVETGDYVVVEGPKGHVVLQVWPAYAEDQGKDLVRLDGDARRAIGAGLGDYVKIKPIRLEAAQRVVLAPTEPIEFGGYYESFVEYVKERLLRKPVSRGESIDIPTLWGSLRLVVVSTQPAAHVYVTEDTRIEIRSEPVSRESLTLLRVTWEDIGDLEEAKQRIREIVELPMRHPELFKRLGIEPPKGILLYGPPGTGKTLLAKALANEIGAYFIAINGPEIMSKYYGESEQRLREIFEQAKKNAPAIIFIDEIDSIA
ncbi:MAG: AAA family ATPase, partial [Desulfurococcaceae archaeon]